VRDVLGLIGPLWVGSALVFGPAAAYVAARRARNPLLWLGFGAIIGPLAVLLLWLAPPGRCAACGEPTAGFSDACVVCGNDVRTGGERAVPAPVVQRSRSVPATPPVAGRSLGRSSQWSTGRGAAVGPAEIPRPFAGTQGAQGDRPGAESVAGRGDEVGVPVMARSLDRLGARRPDVGGPHGAAMGSAMEADPELSILAIGVFATGTEGLSVGSRYLIARSRDRLMIRGPVEPSPSYTELDLPLEGVEANLVEDRLVLSGFRRRRRNRFILGFTAVAQLSTTPLEYAFEFHEPAQQPAVR
jgi:hypothetical protein